MFEFAEHITKLIESHDLDAAAAEVAATKEPARAALGGALLALARQDSAAAIEHASRAVSLGAGAAGHQYLSTSYLTVGDAQRAVEHARKAAALAPSTRTRSALGAVLLTVGALEESSSVLKQLVAEHPDDAEAHLNLAAASTQLGDHATAIIHFARAIELRPGDGRPIEGLINLFANLGKWLGAMAALETSKQRKPPPEIAAAFDLAHLVLVQRVSGTFPPAGALAEVDQIVAGTLATIRTRPVATQLTTARMLFDLGRIDDAKRLVTQLEPETTRPADRANAAYLNGLFLHRAGDGAGALAAYEQALSLDASRVDAAVNAVSLVLEKGPPEALARIGEILDKVEPAQRRQSAELLLNEAVWLVRVGRRGDAVRVLDRAMIVTNGQGPLGELARRALDELDHGAKPTS
jgi:tetratricopeptide (TPR) repeat protein